LQCAFQFEKLVGFVNFIIISRLCVSTYSTVVIVAAQPLVMRPAMDISNPAHDRTTTQATAKSSKTAGHDQEMSTPIDPVNENTGANASFPTVML